MKPLADIEREARATRHRIAELDGLTQKFDQALVRSETERNLHLAKIADEQAHLAELIDAAALIVQHLGAEVPVAAVWEANSPIERAIAEEAADAALVEALFEEQGEAVVAVADSPQEMAFSTIPVNLEGKDSFEGGAQIYEDTRAEVAMVAADPYHWDDMLGWTIKSAEAPAADEPTFEYVAAAVEQIASPPPPAPDATDEPELTDEQVERIEERLATQDPIGAAEADPDAKRELETAGVYVNRVNPFKSWLR